MNISLGQREHLLEILGYEYVIPAEFHMCVKDAIKQYATREYHEATIDSMLVKPQSMAASIGMLHDDNFSLFRGKFVEWLVCIEYNAIKNKGIVLMTIVNPDPTSKADLLHIIQRGSGFEAIPGPDIKSGGSTYVFNQWKKIVTNRYDIPMVDIDGVLTTEEGLKMLTDKQREVFEQLKQAHPRKKPLKSVWSQQDISRLMLDYLKYISEGVTPADTDNKPFVTSKENRERIKSMLFDSPQKDVPQGTWGDLCKRAVELISVEEDYLNPMTIERIEEKRGSEIRDRKKLSHEEVIEEITEKVLRSLSKSGMEKNNGVGGITKTKRKGILSSIVDYTTFAAKKTANFFGYDTPAEMGLAALEKVVEIVDEVGVETVVNAIFGESSNDSLDSSSDTFYYSYEDTETDNTLYSTDDVENSAMEGSRSSSTTHASPKEHTVKPHGQRYNTRDGPIWKEKEPYKRGKNDDS